MISFLLFFGFAILLFCVNMTFYIYKRKKFYLNRVKYMIFSMLICTTTCFIANLPYFITNNSDSFIDKNQGYFIPTVIFNLANIFYSVSVIIFLLSFVQFDKSIIDLEIPTQISNKKGDIPIGRFLKGNAKKKKFYLPLGKLARV